MFYSQSRFPSVGGGRSYNVGSLYTRRPYGYLHYQQPAAPTSPLAAYNQAHPAPSFSGPPTMAGGFSPNATFGGQGNVQGAAGGSQASPYVAYGRGAWNTGAAKPAQPGAPAGGGGVGDYSNDPILQKIKAFAESAIDDANANALAAEKLALIRYGDPELALRTRASRVRGPEIAAQASANPFSTVKELKRWNDRAQVNVDETRNAQNLFYSSSRARDKQLQGEDYLRQSNKAAGEVQDLLTQIAQNLVASKMQYQQMVIQAEEAAYNRALQQMYSQNGYA